MIAVVAGLLTVCVGAARLARRRPDVWLGLGLSATMLPVVATRSWLHGLGPFASIPPAVWILLAGTVALLMDRDRTARRGVTTMLTTVAVVAVVGPIVVYSLHGVDSASALLTLWVLPMAGFAAVLTAMTSARTGDIDAALAPWLTTLALAESLLAVTQHVVGDGIVFDEYRSAVHQFARSGRSTGTFDSPLDLAAFLTLALAVVVRGPHSGRSWTTAVVLTGGVVCTGSRTGIALALLIIMLGVFCRASRSIVELVLAVSVPVAGVLALSSSWAAPFFDRFGERGDRSTWARALARDVGLDLVEAHPLLGNGLVYSYEYALANLPSSFENAWLSLAIGAGIPVTLLFLILPIGTVLIPGPPLLLTRTAAVLALVWGASYSANMGTTTYGLFAWMITGMAASELLQRRREAGERRSPRKQPASVTIAGSRHRDRLAVRRVR